MVKGAHWLARAGSCVRQRQRVRLSSAHGLWFGLALALLAPSANARTIGVAPPQSENFYGQVGLLEMPSARFMPDGEISATVSTTPAMDRYAFGFQALPWLEATFRYARVGAYLPNFTLYDRSLGFKFRLNQEDDFWPSFAVGAMDVLGTGVFGAEYLVASKRFGDFDTTLGIGWRRFAGTASFENPLAAIIPSFKTINTSFGQGGVPDFKAFFHGKNVGLFGGVTWDSPIDGLRLIAEVSGDKYTDQTKTGKVHIRTPFNLGFSYEPLAGLQIGGGYLYGSQLGVRVTVHFNPVTVNPGPTLGPSPVPSQVRSPEERKEAVLALIQAKTHFYTNSPFEVRHAATTKQADIALPSPATLADSLFENATFQTFDVSDVESFGNDLIVDVDRRSNTPACNAMGNLSQAARAAGFDEIVFSSKSGATRICGLKAISAMKVADAVNMPSADDVPASADEPNPNNPAAALTPTIDADENAKARIIQMAEDQGLQVAALSIDEHRVKLAFINKTYLTNTEAIGRLLRILMAAAPSSVEEFRLVDVTNYLPTNAVVFGRSDLERTLTLDGSADELWPLTEIQPVSEYEPFLETDNLISYPNFDYSVTPGFRQSLFNPKSPFSAQLYANLAGSAAFDKHVGIAAAVEYSIFNSIDKNLPANSVLPHVRTDFPKYYVNKLGISDLEAKYFTKLSPEVYLLGRAGYLEDMFAGVGAEVYWQPPHQRWALGATIYGVQQRSFDRLFGLRRYRVITGHFSAYYDSPWYGLDFQIHAGRYLAGDYGATFQVTRRFANGVEIGVYATFTNVPFKKFGEGSFDKGFIIRIPIGAITPLNTQDVANLDFSPITRDGGQRLYGESTLHDTLQRSSENDLLTSWDSVLEP